MKQIFYLITGFFFISGHLLLFLVGHYYLNIDYFYLVIIVFFILSASASWLIAWHDNQLIRFIYFISAIWGGLMLNSLLLFLVFYLLNISHYTDNLILWFSLILFLLLLSQYLLAINIKTRKITVYIKDLPEFWQDKKIVQVSDLHLGPIWRINFFEKVVAKINKLNPAAVFITGDLFDGMEADFSWFNSINSLKIKSELGTFYSYGNHDEMLGSKVIDELLGRNGIKILRDKMLIIEGLQIIGLNSCHQQKNINLKEIGYNHKEPSIVMLHEPISLEKFAVSLQLSGHTHGGQMFPINLVNKLLYNGYDFGLFKNKDFNLNVSSGAGTWGPPLRFFSRSEVVEIKLKKK